MNSIDPAEAALSVIGVDAVISRSVEKVTSAQRKDMRRLDKAIRFKVKASLSDEPSAKYTLPPDYMKLLGDLTSPIMPDQINKMISFLPMDVQSSFISIASNAYEKLQQEMPKNSVQTIAGIRQLNPDDPSYFHFHWIYSVLDNPLRVIELIGNGSLLRVQTEAVREIYPSISSAIDNVFDEEIPAKKAKDESYELPMETEIGFRVWRSLPVVQGDYQQLYFDANKERDTDPEPSKSQLSNSAAASVSPAGAAMYPKAAG